MSLREVVAADLPTFFEHIRDAAASHMAAFTAKDPDDREAFDAKWCRILADEAVLMRTIVCDGDVVGHIGRYESRGVPKVTYWIGRQHWGKGIATQALRQFLVEVSDRPLFASAASDNVGSLRVLAKSGFQIRGRERALASSRGEVVEEIMLELR